MSDQEPASPDLTSLNPPKAFLNIPYDDKFETLYLADIAGITAYGLIPRATLEVPAGVRRLLKSLSDLAGTDAYVHDGRPRGLFRQLSNALVRSEHPPTVEEMASVHRALQSALPAIRKRAAARSAFDARVFTELVVTARAVGVEVLDSRED